MNPADLKREALVLPSHHNVWEEAWTYAPENDDDEDDEDAFDVTCEDCVGGIRFGVPARGGHPPGSCFARARLATAAPKMARLLLELASLPEHRERIKRVLEEAGVPVQ